MRRHRHRALACEPGNLMPPLAGSFKPTDLDGRGSRHAAVNREVERQVGDVE
jgi:hypothetical protein